jgi:hypothetical protein
VIQAEKMSKMEEQGKSEEQLAELMMEFSGIPLDV